MGKIPLYKLTELVPLNKLQRIQDSFAKANQVACTITEIDGTPITKPSNHCLICKMVRKTEKGLANCIKSGKEIGEKAAKYMRPFHQQCLSCGFTDAAAPIMVKGNHIANWLIGQYHVRDVNEHQIKQYAIDIGANTSRMVEAFQLMPKLTTERFESCLSFLWIMANEISEMGYQRLRMKQQTEELITIKKELERHKSSLEDEILKRTQSLVEVNDQLQTEIHKSLIIQKEQRRLITAFENTAESIIITDPDFTVIYANPATAEISGFPLVEITGKKISFLKNSLTSKSTIECITQTLQNGSVWKERLRSLKKNGDSYDEATTISPVFDTNSTLISYVCVTRDITKELATEKQLAHTSKLESIGTLAAGLAHEINTPTQFISTNIDFFNDAFSDINTIILTLEKISETQKQIKNSDLNQTLNDCDWWYLKDEIPGAVEQSREGVERIASIVNALKKFSQSGSREMTNSCLNEIIENTLIVSSNEWKYSVDITKRLDPNLPLIPLLAEEIGQVILSMLVNSVQAIKTKFGELDNQPKGQIEITTKTSGNMVEFQIQDNGCGISDSIKGRIFDPFFTTKEVGQGAGQGLNIVNDIITKKHNGKISFISQEGIGTTFTLLFPLTQMIEH